MSATPEVIPFDSVGRIPAPGDNVAIATRRLEAGSRVAHGGRTFDLTHTVLEGHRFVLDPIRRDQALLSWGLPFGIAIRDLGPGEYVRNEKILRVLAERDIDFALPESANFRDALKTYTLDEQEFRPGRQVDRVATPATFDGFPRSGRRGVGTRNFVVILATTSQTAAFATALAGRFQATLDQCPNIDGVVAVTHTEGGGVSRPNNLDFVLRTLAGFMVHDNVGAVLAIDYGSEAFTNDDLRRFMEAQDYLIGDVRHRFFRIDGDFGAELDRGEEIVRGWLPEVNRAERSPQPLSHLKIALQCGGSDAFSGVSGNALAGWVAKALIRNGGSANLAETDELIGAEPYVLSNVRDLATARSFLDKIEAFKKRASDHGATAEGNPSGGNNYRGLYNIALKSIGAARKRDPEVCLDYVLDYAQPMADSGYYFMDSPGNDLESIAGQVASGSNLILFITGNGSITNFPFVPTLKFVTTTGRFNLLANEMDVNAGRYNDGTPMAELGRETFELARKIASGERSKGELAGHAQVSIWRDWRQTDGCRIESIRSRPEPRRAPLPVLEGPPAKLTFNALKTDRGYTCDQIGLVMPTSLCSGQVARIIAQDLNRRPDFCAGVSRYVALVHTEGCGSANSEGIYLQTLLGHLRHRFTKRAVLLEHGCEKTHNDAVRHYLDEHGLGTDRFGWASVQLDGGIECVREKVAKWFADSLGDDGLPPGEPVGAEALRLGLLSGGPVSELVAGALARLVQALVMGGATVVVAENASLANSAAFRQGLLESRDAWTATLAYGEATDRRGLHVMETPTENPVETITGLGGTGVEVMLAHIGQTPLQTHPMIPLLQVSSVETTKRRYAQDLDLLFDADTPAEELLPRLLTRIGETASRDYVPKLFGQGNSNFQLTRGLLGLSL